MRAIMGRVSHGSSLSFSRRHFQWLRRKASEGDGERKNGNEEEGEEEEEEEAAAAAAAAPLKKTTPSTAEAVTSRLRSALTSAVSGRRPAGLGSRVSGTLFGHRRGHVHLAFQADARSSPAMLIEFATPTSTLVREMASGLVRIALECDRKGGAATATAAAGAAGRLLEEPLWRAYCNGRRCGHAVRRDCGPDDWKVLRAVEPVTMGAGVLPGKGTSAGDGDIMYMRARFERVAGSKDSEAFYMMNPDGNGGPELSIYLLRV